MLPFADMARRNTAKPAAKPKRSPAMEQYHRFKEAHPDCMLFFRMGDFYELFYDDAIQASKLLGLTLTERTKGVPMAGAPHHQLDTYLRKALACGLRVAVADQIQDPKEAKGVVDRAVTRVITSGTLIDDALLDDAAVNRIAAVAFTEDTRGPVVGLAIIEASTGSFVVRSCQPDEVVDCLSRASVSELLFADMLRGELPERIETITETLGITATPVPAWHFRRDEAIEALTSTYGVSTLDGFGLDADDPEVLPAGALVRYLAHTQTPMGETVKTHDTQGLGLRVPTLAHLQPPRKTTDRNACIVDAISLRALEVESTIRSSGNHLDGSLLGIFLRAKVGFGNCRTAMGKRLLRDWLCEPLCDREAIMQRQQCVAALAEDRTSADELGSILDQVQDVARIVSRIALARLTPRDLVALGTSLDTLDAITQTIAPAPAFAHIAQTLCDVRDALAPLAGDITRSCVDTPPTHMREGGLIRDGVDAKLDQYRSLIHESDVWLAQYQARLTEELGLVGAKVGYNAVFGYYIELTKAQVRDLAEPIERANLNRRQTLRNAERYITPELKDFEERVMSAQSQAVAREQALFAQLVDKAAARISAIATFARAIAQLDVLLALADKAAHRHWIQPELVEEPVLKIDHSRHPVLDEKLASDFVPNDVAIGCACATTYPQGVDADQHPAGADCASLILLTGPNMAGKSTYIRQVALLTLLAHTGSFVPADRATIGLCDRIFTRVGADDALHRGQSTFMVEMTETANILNHATSRSLVILDEIGRGTSTFDGLSLAWAIAEYLAMPRQAPARPTADASVASPPPLQPGPRTLFATHYHELTELDELLPGRVRTMQVAVRQWTTPEGQQDIAFLHTIVPGRADQSYGLHVARLAGIPRQVVSRADEILRSLRVERNSTARGAGEAHAGSPALSHQAMMPPDGQLSLFVEYVEHPVVASLREIKLESLSPIDAFDLLRTLKEQTASGDCGP